MVTPGNATGSLLYQALTGTGGAVRMGNGGAYGTFTAAQVQAVADWINQGALNN